MPHIFKGTNGRGNSETCKCPACGKQVKQLRNNLGIAYCGTHTDNRGMACRGAGLIPKQAIREGKRDAEIKKILEEANRPHLLIRYSVSGSHYESTNQFPRPVIKSVRHLQ